MGKQSHSFLDHVRRWHGATWLVVVALRLGGALCIVLLGLALPLLTAQAAGADGRPPGGRLDDPTVRQVDIASPAVVRLAILFDVKITLTLCGQNITLPSSGNGYLTGGLGSGAFISANGDILTADHMVAAYGADVVGNPTADRDIANVLDNNPTDPSCRLQSPVSPTDIFNGFLDTAGITYRTQVSHVQHLVWQGTPYSGQLDTTSSQSFLQALQHVPLLAATVRAESAPSENDLAIVHVDQTDTPSIQLDDSAQVAIDDQLTIIGYPGNGDQFRAVSDQTVDANDLLTPSVNNVTVSSIKSNSNGARLIQVAGNVEHGDSGGPALDAAGHVVGVVSFGTSDGTAETVGSTSFLRSSDDVQPLITQANISTAPGAFEKQWEQAFSDYAATSPGHWHTAARELDALANSYPSFKGIQPYKDYADKAAAVEQLPPDDAGIMLIISIVVAVALLAAIVLAVVLLRQRRNTRRAAALAMASQGMPFGSYGPPSPYSDYGRSPQFNGYGPPSQYGGYAPPSQYGGYSSPAPYAAYPAPAPHNPMAAPQPSGPTVPYANSAAVPADSEAPLATGGRGAAPGDAPETLAPLGRMSFPQVSNPAFPPVSNPGYGVAGGELSADGGSYRNGTSYPSAVPARDASGWPSAVPHPQHNGAVSISTQERGICTNGHSMPPGEVYCGMCGAPRTPAASSQPGF